MLIIPIRTEIEVRRTPVTNYALIGVNVLCYAVLNMLFPKTALARTELLALHAHAPEIYQFFTYQFLHADIWHLLANMLFLWVFGNAVNAKMGDWPYLLFYVAGGVFAGWGHALIAPGPSQLIGASGAIAAVTTAYLALAPRSRVTVLVWLFIFIHFFEVRAMIIIVLKIIVWDNIVAPGLGGSGTVAHGAHLAGYLFGFVASLLMLVLRALPRDQFDILAVWKRWKQRNEFALAMRDPAARARAQYGNVARITPEDETRRREEERRFDRLADLRSRISERLDHRDIPAAAEVYLQLVAIDPDQCLSERHQLEIAREFYHTGRYPEAAAAFDRFLACYPNSPEAANVRLLVGIIYARDLQQYEDADKHLTRSMESLRDPSRRDQCIQWLNEVRAALGRPAPEASGG